MISGAADTKISSPLTPEMLNVLQEALASNPAAGATVTESVKAALDNFRQYLPLPMRHLDLRRALQLTVGKRELVDRRDQFMGEPKENAEGKDVHNLRDVVADRVRHMHRERVSDAKREAKQEHLDRASRHGNHLSSHHGRVRGSGENVHVSQVNHSGDVSMDQHAASDRVDKMLSAFERMVVSRFEQGTKITRELKDGQASFLPKSDAQWKSFLQSLLHRTVAKRIALEDIKDFLFRGLIQKGDRGMFIGDMRLNSGRIEKFIRFAVLADALAQLKQLDPGVSFDKLLLGALTGDELQYLALTASKARELAASMAPEKGLFMDGRAEERAAQALGIQLDHQLRHKARQLKSRRGGGLFKGGLLGEDEILEESAYRFVPWWRWGNISSPTLRSKWITIVFYGSLLIVSLLGIATGLYQSYRAWF